MLVNYIIILLLTNKICIESWQQFIIVSKQKCHKSPKRMKIPSLAEYEKKINRNKTLKKYIYSKSNWLMRSQNIYKLLIHIWRSIKIYYKL